MTEVYHDAMGICKTYGFPDVFITFTRNPKWPEIVRFLQSKDLRQEDRLDIMSRVFRIKLDLLVKDLKKENIFGRAIPGSVAYHIEFQIRGLPHAHIVLWLTQDDKLQNSVDIDKLYLLSCLIRKTTLHCMH